MAIRNQGLGGRGKKQGWAEEEIEEWPKKVSANLTGS